MTDSPQHQTQAAADLRAEEVTILYTNWRGETAVRRIIPNAKESGTGLAFWFGSTEWHPEPQWLLTAEDVEKDALRDFALSGIKAWGSDAIEALAASPPQAETPGLDREAVEVLQNCAEAVAFFDQVKASSEDEKIAVGRDHWNWMESACRRAASLASILAATAVSQPPTSRDDRDEHSNWLRSHDRCIRIAEMHAEQLSDDAAKHCARSIAACIGDPWFVLRDKDGAIQPPTSRQGAGEVEALRAMLDEIQDAANELLMSLPGHWHDDATIRLTDAAVDARNLLQQPAGYSPSDDEPDNRTALAALEASDRWARDEQTKRHAVEDQLVAARSSLAEAKEAAATIEGWALKHFSFASDIDDGNQPKDADAERTVGRAYRRSAELILAALNRPCDPRFQPAVSRTESFADTKLRHRIIRIMLDEIAGDEERAPVPVYGIDEAAEKIMAAIGEAR